MNRNTDPGRLGIPGLVTLLFIYAIIIGGQLPLGLSLILFFVFAMAVGFVDGHIKKMAAQEEEDE